MSTLQVLILIAVAAQLPLAGVAALIEFSLRKKRPSRAAAPAEPKRPAPERAVRPPQPKPKAEVGAVPAAPAQPAPEAGPEEQRAPEIKPPEEAEAKPEAEIVKPAAAAAPEPSITPAPAPAEAEAPAPEEAAPEAPAAEAEIVEAQPPAMAPRPAPKPIGLGLRKTREHFLARIRSAITGSAKVDEIYEGLEEALIGADVGVDASLKLVEAVRGRLKNDARAEVIRDALKDEIERVMAEAARPMTDSGDDPLVIMVAGVNGVGKTTTVAKLASLFKNERGTVIVAAADTFRAAAVEQLDVWCKRVGVEMIRQKQGSDPAAVAFDAVKAAVARKAKVVIIDTAGRLQTKVNLMEELKKIARVTSREIKGAPHETWLVLDATTGQNALSQAKIFGDATPLTGVVLTKLDSTAKGGVIVGISAQMKLPVRFVGVGEELDDLRPFDAHEFTEALFAESEGEAQAASGTYAA